MKMKYLSILVLILSVSAFSACRNKSDEPAPAVDQSPASVGVSVSKAMALANGSDTVTVSADVKTAAGAAVPDGTVVAFTAPDGGTLSASSAATANGVAAVTFTHDPVQGARNHTCAVVAAAGSFSGARDVKFINQPTQAEVSVAFDPAVANLASLQFVLNNSAGATFNDATQPIAAVNNAAGGSLASGHFNAAANATTVGLVNASGLNTGIAPIVRATFAVASGAGLPTFSIDQTPAGFIASDSAGVDIPGVTQANMTVKVVFDTE